MTAAKEAEPRREPARSVAQVVLHAPRPVRVLVAGVFLNRLGSFFSTFLVLFLKQEGFSLRQLPILLLVVGTAIPIGSLLGGWAADRFSRKMSLVASTILASAALMLIGVAPARGVVIVGVFGAALFAQAYLPGASALLVDYSAEQDRVPTFALFRLALNLGAALGPLIAALVAPYGLHLLFLLNACTYLLFGMLLGIGLPARRRMTPQANSAEHDGPPKAEATRHEALTDAETGPPEAEPVASAIESSALRGPAYTRMLAFYGAVLGITAVYAQYSSTVSLAVAASRSTAAYATLLTLNGALVIVAELPLTSITRRLHWWIPMASGTALMAVGIAASGVFHAYALIAFGVVVWTTGEMLFSPVVNSAVAAFSPSARIGRYQGYLSTVQAIAFAVGPPLGILVYGYSKTVLWLGCLAVGAMACAGIGLAGASDLAHAGRGASASCEPVARSEQLD